MKEFLKKKTRRQGVMKKIFEKIHVLSGLMKKYLKNPGRQRVREKYI